jgi:hypothetical protein
MKISSAGAYLVQKLDSKKDSSDKPDEQELFVCGLIRDIRVHTQDTQSSVVNIQSTMSPTDGEARLKRLAQGLARNRASFERNKKNVTDLLTQLKTIFVAHHALYNYFGDEISHVANLWDRTIENWPAETDAENQAAGKLAEIEKWLREVIWHCGFVTIPPRINEHLKGLRAGQALNFHKNFIDELPDKEDRDKILKYLKDHPLYIEGVTDAENGIIYRAARDPRIRRRSFFTILTMILSGLILVCLTSYIGDWFNLTGWPVRSNQLQSFVLAYLFVLLGSLLHVVIAAFKQARSGTEQPFTALEDFSLWVHVKEVPIMGGILTIWIGLFGMVFLGKLPEWQTALFVGYGIDSIVDVMLRRFEAKAPKGLVDL